MEFRFFFPCLKFEVRIVKFKKEKKKFCHSEEGGTYCSLEQLCCCGLWLGSWLFDPVVMVWRRNFFFNFYFCYNYLIKQYIICDSHFLIAVFCIIDGLFLVFGKQCVTVAITSLCCYFFLLTWTFPVGHSELWSCIYRSGF